MEGVSSPFDTPSFFVLHYSANSWAVQCLTTMLYGKMKIIPQKKPLFFG